MEKKRLNKNLAEVDGTITSVLEKSIPLINKLHTSKEVYDFVEFTFATNAISTPCSEKMLDKLRKMKDFAKSITFVYNTMLAGEGLNTL